MDDEWRGISYLIFELPNAEGDFQTRSKRIVEIVQKANIPHLKAVAQFHVKNEAELKARLKKVVANGGEGLMLHRADALYTTGRSDVLLKLKPLFDAEATVVAHTPGKGKHKSKLGALIVETPEGIRFILGTGLAMPNAKIRQKLVASLLTLIATKHQKANLNLPVFYAKDLNKP
jgi:DNA ligase-1